MTLIFICSRTYGRASGQTRAAGHILLHRYTDTDTSTHIPHILIYSWFIRTVRASKRHRTLHQFLETGLHIQKCWACCGKRNHLLQLLRRRRRRRRSELPCTPYFEHSRASLPIAMLCLVAATHQREGPCCEIVALHTHASNHQCKTLQISSSNIPV
jgi:hypothetical protein